MFYLPNGIQGGKGVRVVDCVLALKSFNESKKTGVQTPCKYGGLVQPLTSRKYFILKNSDAFMNKTMRSHSKEAVQHGFSEEQNIGTDFSPESNEKVSVAMQWNSYFALHHVLYFVMTFVFLSVEYYGLT